MGDMLAHPMDVYFAFRNAFVDLPHVRIYTRDHRIKDKRPGYSSGRFVVPAAPSISVFLYDERRTDDAAEAPYPACMDSRGNVRPIYDSAEEWAKATRAMWSRA